MKTIKRYIRLLKTIYTLWRGYQVKAKIWEEYNNHKKSIEVLETQLNLIELALIRNQTESEFITRMKQLVFPKKSNHKFADVIAETRRNPNRIPPPFVSEKFTTPTVGLQTVLTNEARKIVDELAKNKKEEITTKETDYNDSDAEAEFDEAQELIQKLKDEGKIKLW